MGDFRNQAQTPQAESQPCLDACQRSEGFDIPLLDDALIRLLLPDIQSMFKYLEGWYTSDSNSKLIETVAANLLKAVMMYTTNMHSPAMRNLNVSVRPGPSSLTTKAQSNSSHTKIRTYGYIAVACLLPAIHAIVKYRESSLQSSLQNSSSHENEVISQRRRAQTRQSRILQKLLQTASLFVPPLQLYYYISYMFQRKSYHSPSIAMNQNNLQYSSANATSTLETKDRSINFLYAYRRILYEELMLTAGMLPIDVWKKIPESLTRIQKKTKNQFNSFIQHTRMRLNGQHDSGCDREVGDEDLKCTICSAQPISIPYKSSCGHWACYTCLRLAISDNLNYRCETCGKRVTYSEPY